MPSPNVKFIASEKTDNKRNNWESDLSGFLQTAKNSWSQDMVGVKEDTLYGSVVTNVQASLSDSIRDDLEDRDLSTLRYAVDHLVDTNSTDSVIVFDDYDYSEFIGLADIGGEKEDKSIRVGVCGSGKGFTSVAALHETLHTFNAKHKNHLAKGLADGTVMGAGVYDDCNDHDNWPDWATTEINNSYENCSKHSPTHIVVAGWVHAVL